MGIKTYSIQVIPEEKKRRMEERGKGSREIRRKHENY
jgi:hypothetical protein